MLPSAASRAAESRGCPMAREPRCKRSRVKCDQGLPPGCAETPKGAGQNNPQQAEGRDVAGCRGDCLRPSEVA